MLWADDFSACRFSSFLPFEIRSVGSGEVVDPVGLVSWFARGQAEAKSPALLGLIQYVKWQWGIPKHGIIFNAVPEQSKEVAC